MAISVKEGLLLLQVQALVLKAHIAQMERENYSVLQGDTAKGLVALPLHLVLPDMNAKKELVHRPLLLVLLVPIVLKVLPSVLNALLERI